MTRFWKRAVPHFLLASLLTAPVAILGCAEHSQYRVYDPDDGTYHYWDGEAPYYQQWEYQTRRRDRDYRKRNNEEQREYWQWRQNHRDNDHRDRDRNRRGDRDDRDNH
jgi:hypothetical protein